MTRPHPADIRAVQADRRPHWNATIALVQQALVVKESSTRKDAGNVTR